MLKTDSAEFDVHQKNHFKAQQILHVSSFAQYCDPDYVFEINNCFGLKNVKEKWIKAFEAGFLV